MIREEVIETLEYHLDACKCRLEAGEYQKDEWGEKIINALNFAINSIKVDLAYDLAYEEAESEDKENPYKDFCEFVAKMILNDDFEENAGANAEFLCRKLSKLGIVKADEDEWVLVESEGKECQESQ